MIGAPTAGHRVRRYTLLCAIAVTGQGCGEPEGRAASGQDLRVAIDTVDDVIYVRNAGEPERWSLEELVTLGTVEGASDGSDPQEFGAVTDIAADPSGLIYVADAQSAEVRVFTEGGELVRRIGRRGSGPGEFNALMSIGWVGDALGVLDPRNARFSLLSVTGDWLDQRPFMPMDGVSLLPAGAGLVYVPVLRIGEGGREVIHVRHGISGPVDSLSSPSSIPDDGLTLECTYMGGTRFGRRRASFAPRTLRVPAPGLVFAQAWNADYRIAFVTADADTVRVVERALPGRPVDDAAWGREAAAFDDFLAEYPDAQCDGRRLPRPDAMRHFRLIFFDNDDRLWVERETDDGLMLDAFDPEGRLLGQVPIPDRSQRVRPHVSGDRLYLVVTDASDVQFVKAFRIGTR